MALYLAERGFRVYGTTRDERQADDLRAAAPRNADVRVLPLDVTNQESIDAAVKTIIAESGGIYGVIATRRHRARGYFGP
jgi:NAD(P)-dependent dehydrogenase (short-subunit alcohol dehydrogenase family)